MKNNIVPSILTLICLIFCIVSFVNNEKILGVLWLIFAFVIFMVSINKKDKKK